MCYNCAEKRKLIQTIDSLFTVDRQHWVLIKNKSLRFEVIPATSYESVKADVELIYTPAKMPETKTILQTIKTKKK